MIIRIIEKFLSVITRLQKSLLRDYVDWFIRSRVNKILMFLSAVAGISVFLLVSKIWEEGITVGEWLRLLLAPIIALYTFIMISMPVYIGYRITKYKVRREVKEEYLSKIKDKDFHDDDRRSQLRKEKEEYEFRKNLKSRIVLQSLEVANMQFFDDFEWEFSPGMNVLLGRNGYGKTHLLRAITSLLYKDKEKSAEYFEDGKKTGQLHLFLAREEESKEIVRTSRFFELSVGKVPILAIPDSRFVDRSVRTVGLVDQRMADLSKNGAHHFLYQEPYQIIIQTLLYQLCYDYSMRQRKFMQPVFELVREVVKGLTDSSFEFHRIKELDSAQFTIEVITEGNENNPLPIQQASQGTLSVLSMFGLVYYYLRSVFRDTDDYELAKKPAIVLIDEIDAHLHPTWQRRMVPLLRKHFPNIQFIVTAHSSLVVAGCLDGEVAVLQKGQNGFRVEKLENDFIGWEPDEIYRKVFEVEKKDESYLYYNTLYPKREEMEKRIIVLEKEDNLSEKEELELQKLRDNVYYANKARQKQSEQMEYKQLLRENEMLKKRMARLEAGGEDASQARLQVEDVDTRSNEVVRDKTEKAFKKKSKKRVKKKKKNRYIED